MMGFPVLGGHEGAGVVTEVGPGVTEVAPGDHVVLSFIPSCGNCPSCQAGMRNLCDLGAGLLGGLAVSDNTHRIHTADGDPVFPMTLLGTFSPYMVVHKSSVVKIDPSVPFEVACLVGCGVTTGYGSAVRAGDIRPGDDVAIVGPGPVGLLSVQLAVAAGARNVVMVGLPEDAARLELARTLGATVETCRLPHAPHALAAYYLIAPAECSSNLARYDGVRYGLRVDGDDLVSMYTRTRHDGFGAEVKRRIMLGTYALSSGYYDAYYGRAQKVRTLISGDFRAAWEQFDFVATPTAPSVAFELGAKTADPLAMYLNDFCTVPMSLAGIPGISIPCGLSDGLPVGFQLAGPAFSENALLDAAYALERSIDFRAAPWRNAG
jgi:hypothetical protein